MADANNIPSPPVSDLGRRLRLASDNIRRKSMPLSDLIPMMQQAADELDNKARAAEELRHDVHIPGAASDEDHALTVAYMQGRSDERGRLRELLLRAAALLSERAPCADSECRLADDGAAIRCIDDLMRESRTHGRT